MQEQIFDMLLKEDEITWQTIIYDLVKSEQMDPWDVDISILTKKYMQILKKLKGMDCRVSGKVLLAAAILLKIKTKRLVDDDLSNLDKLISSIEEPEDESFYDDLEDEFMTQLTNAVEEKPKLIPRTPQPRKRKVSLYDLMEALDKALEVKKRRIVRKMPSKKATYTAPKSGVDLSHVMKQVYRKLLTVFNENKVNKCCFSNIIPAETKEGKVLTFIPMLHLTNQRKIDINQDCHFGEIEIALLKKLKEDQIEKELAISEE